jgi:hypothetical protein
MTGEIAACIGDHQGADAGDQEREREAEPIDVECETVLKSLIRVINTPMLLVRPTARMPFRLKVGEEIA